MMLFFLHRTLTDRQKALLTSYAEDEREVEGTVNGVTTTATGVYVYVYLYTCIYE